MTREEAFARLKAQIQKGEELVGRPAMNSEEEINAFGIGQIRWSKYNSEMLARMFDNRRYQQEYDAGGHEFVFVDPRPFYPYSLQDHVKLAFEFVREKIEHLVSLEGRLPVIDEPLENNGMETAALSAPKSKKNVFLVHGHDRAVLQEAARFLEHLELKPIILHEQASGGRTLIEKLEHYADTAFAVVLLTPDDFGGANGKEKQARARQNVVLELGYFFGRLGRGHVAALYLEPLELPSDLQGIVYIGLDKAGAWKVALAREMKAADIEIDMNNAI